MSEATSSADQMTDTQFTESSSNKALLDIPYLSTSSTSTCNYLNNMQLVSKTINVLSNNMQLTLPQAHEHSEMNDVQLSSESNQVHVLKLLENLIEKASAPSAPAESLEIMSAHPNSNPIKINMQKRSEPFQITDTPYDKFQEASSERTLLRTFSATSVQPLKTNKRPSEDFQHLMNADTKV